jgi:hypothetical protein
MRATWPAHFTPILFSFCKEKLRTYGQKSLSIAGALSKTNKLNVMSGIPTLEVIHFTESVLLFVI